MRKKGIASIRALLLAIARQSDSSLPYKALTRPKQGPNRPPITRITLCTQRKSKPNKPF